MKIKNILVTTDDSACARGAAAHGTALARAFDGTVYAVSAVDPSRFGGHAAGNAANLAERQEAHARDAAERAVERVADRAQAADVPAETAVERGSPYEVLRRRVRESGIDLVAMGTHGRTGLDRHLLGSVAERAMRTSSVPVLTAYAGGGDGSV